MKKSLLTIALAFLLMLSTFAQSIFTNPVTGTNPNTANPYIAGQTVNSNLTASGIGRGAGISGQNANDRYNASSWNTNVIDLTAYFEFTITPNANAVFSLVSFVYTGQVSNANISNFAFRSSVDGYTADIGTPVATGATINLSVPAYQNLTSAITFRFYAWGALAASANTFSINDFTFNGVTGVLPISIEYINGTKQSTGNAINWKVNCSSSPSATLTVQRSSDGRNYYSINSITVSEQRCLEPFNYLDITPAAGYNYYRLKMTDAFDKTTYSAAMVILNKETGFDITGLLPSLVKTKAILNIAAAQKIQMNIVVTDFAGRQVQSKNFILLAGSNQLEMNFDHLAAGAYQLFGYTTEGKTKTIRFIKQ